MRTLVLTCSLLLGASLLVPGVGADGGVAVCSDAPEAQLAYTWTGPPNVYVGLHVYGGPPWVQGSLTSNPC